MELRSRIRNIPCETPGSLDPKERHAYEVGFFSAIDAAVELVGSKVIPVNPGVVVSSDQTLNADCRKPNNKRTDLLDLVRGKPRPLGRGQERHGEAVHLHNYCFAN